MRIGLSATQRPIELIGRFLTGAKMRARVQDEEWKLELIRAS